MHSHRLFCPPLLWVGALMTLASASAQTTWKVAADGLWTHAASWSAGVPNAGVRTQPGNLRHLHIEAARAGAAVAYLEARPAPPGPILLLVR